MISPRVRGRTVFMSFCLLAYGTSALRLGGRVFSVNVDLARPETIVWPCEVSIVGDLGEKGLRIPPKVGSGWEKKAGGKAAYRFYVPEEGRYQIWAYALWFDACANAVYARIDDLNKAIIGNDPIYGRWHWVRGFAVRLKEGAHALELSNHSDHISLQKLLLVNSETSLPDDCSLVFSDLFYDGFDGCHIGNFASWEPITGQWEVSRPDADLRYVENALVGRAAPDAVIVYDAPDWSSYSYHVALRFDRSYDPGSAVGLLFGVQDTEDCYAVLCRSLVGLDEFEMELSRWKGQAHSRLEVVRFPCRPECWHEVEVVLTPQAIKVLCDEKPQMEMATTEDIRGGIGLCLQGNSVAYFDDIHVVATSEQ
jgi:hypothetical protein